MNVALRERNFYVVLVEHVIDILHNSAYGKCLLHYVHPAEHLEVDAVVAELVEHHGSLFLLVHIGQFQGVGAVLDELYHGAHVRTVSYSERYCGEHVSVVLCQVLIVLREELRVGEGDNTAVDSLEQR